MVITGDTMLAWLIHGYNASQYQREIDFQQLIKWLVDSISSVKLESHIAGNVHQ